MAYKKFKKILPVNTFSVCRFFILYILAVLSELAEAIFVPVKLKVTSNISSVWPTKVCNDLDVLRKSHNLQVRSIEDVTICVPE